MRRSERTVLVAFLVAAMLAGASGVGIRFSNRELDPLWGAGLRFGLAALVLGALMAVFRLPFPSGRPLRGVVLFGSLNFGAGYALAYLALTELQAGFGQILMALVPLLTLLLAVGQGQERMRAPALAGTVLALAGVIVMSQAPLRASVPFAAVLAAVGSALCVAQAAVLIRRFPPVHPVVVNAAGMGVGAALLLLGSLLAGEELELPEARDTWIALAYLVVVGSVIVFALYIFVLGRWEASRAAYAFVLMPFVTIVISSWLDDERIGWELLFGGALVLGGVYAGALRPSVALASDASPPRDRVERHP